MNRTNAAGRGISDGSLPYEPPAGRRKYVNQSDGVVGTQVDARDRNALQEEVVRFLELMGVVPTADRVNQVGVFMACMVRNLLTGEAGKVLESALLQGNDPLENDDTANSADKPSHVVKVSDVSVSDIAQMTEEVNTAGRLLATGTAGTKEIKETTATADNVANAAQLPNTVATEGAVMSSGSAGSRNIAQSDVAAGDIVQMTNPISENERILTTGNRGTKNIEQSGYEISTVQNAAQLQSTVNNEGRLVATGGSGTRNITESNTTTTQIANAAQLENNNSEPGRILSTGTAGTKNIVQTDFETSKLIRSNNDNIVISMQFITENLPQTENEIIFDLNTTIDFTRMCFIQLNLALANRNNDEIYSSGWQDFNNVNVSRIVLVNVGDLNRIWLRTVSTTEIGIRQVNPPRPITDNIVMCIMN